MHVGPHIKQTLCHVCLCGGNKKLQSIGNSNKYKSLNILWIIKICINVLLILQNRFFQTFSCNLPQVLKNIQLFLWNGYIIVRKKERNARFIMQRDARFVN